VVARRVGIVVSLMASLVVWASRATAQTPSPLCQTGCTGGYSVEVQQKGNPHTNYLNSSPDTVQFTVSNDGTNSDTYTFTCQQTGGISCISVSPSSATIQADGFKNVKVVYGVGSTVGNVQLKASGHATDTGWYAVNANPTVTLVAPLRTSGRAIVATRQPLIRALFLPNGSSLDTTQTLLTWKHGSTMDTVTTFHADSLSVPRQNRGLLEWEVDSLRWLSGRPDSAQIRVKACAQNGLCTWDSAWAVLVNDSTPILGFTGRPLEALGRVFGAPFGPGLSASGAEVEAGFAIPAYVSMGVARSAGLVYSTRTSYPRALVAVDFELTWPSGNPSQLKLILHDGGAAAAKLDSLVVTNVDTLCTKHTPARRCRAILQGDYSTLTISPRKWLAVEVQVTSGSIMKAAVDSTEVVLVDRRATPYGSGWWPSGYAKLIGTGSDRLLVSPTGSAAIYRGNGDSLYISPPGDFSTLIKTASGWELHSRGTLAKAVFDSNGRLQAAVDASGNRDSMAYSGSTDTVTKQVDPVGKVITLTYSSGKLSSFTDPGGRQSIISINGSNQLVYDSISSPTSRAYTTTFVYQGYSGTGTVLLTKRIGVLADTTIVAYDSTFKRRPTQVTLPSVRDETNTVVWPVVTYTAYERRGFGALVSLDSVYVEVKDPRNNWTRSLLNRWGEARKTWDALGLLGQAAYTADGFARWSEGKVADSSRVYTRYDSGWHPWRSLIRRSATDSLILSTVIYDASDRVIKTVDARGDTARITYDSLGRVLSTITPHNDTTRYHYRSDGLVDSTWAPGSAQAKTLAYHATWKNLVAARDELGTMTDSVTLDAWGRDSLNDAPIRVQLNSSGQPIWQWRRSQPFYNVAGQADSTRLVRSNNCTNYCSNPTWPGGLDTNTTQVQHVRHLFDRVGRDSVRLNDRNKAVRYLYDRLGRILTRRDPAGAQDSFAYDIAGNLKKIFTRRGDSITVNYDSRNRDTLRVIPGVGTLRKTFGGPADQLTRLWYDTPIDSTGYAKGELDWNYDQRGRLTADTSFSGTQAKWVTRYAYDTYERLSTRTDTLGTWTTRYETSRGVADTLITPLGDTVSYTFDSRSRAVGPTMRSGATPFSRWLHWNSTSNLRWLNNSVAGTSPYDPGDYDSQYDSAQPDSNQAPLVPAWLEQHGATAADVIQDTVSQDGWERVLGWRQFKNGTLVASDSFALDRDGNLKTTAGAEVYDSVTDRLVQMTVGSSNWTFTYDAAGNLTRTVKSGSNPDTLTYAYDALNQLRSVRWKSTLVARYTYDVLGRRIAKRVYSTQTGGTVGYTGFVYAGANVAFEVDTLAHIGLRYTWGPDADDLLAIRDASGNHYYVTQDKLHSVRGLVKRDGTWVESIRYRPYGATVARDTNSAVNLGFVVRYGWTGREYDPETGWYYFRARYYDLTARRFVQEDPIAYAGGSNIYAYGEGSPLEGRDPGGTVMNCNREACDQMAWASNCWSINCNFDYDNAGNWWSHQEEFWGDGIVSAFDLETPVEQSDEYQQYVANAKKQLANGGIDSSNASEMDPTTYSRLREALDKDLETPGAPAADLPLYAQVANTILEGIQSGHWVLALRSFSWMGHSVALDCNASICNIGAETVIERPQYFVFVSPDLWRYSRGFILNFEVHEYSHLWQNTNDSCLSGGVTSAYWWGWQYSGVRLQPQGC